MSSGNFSKGLLLLITLIMSFAMKAQLAAKFNATPQNGCAPLIVKFSDQSTGNPVYWKWDLGNGTTSYLQNPSGIYFTAGKYTVKLLVKNASNQDSVAKTDYIEVYSNPIADFSVNKTTGCYPLNVQFTDNSTTASGTINSWLWDFGDGFTSTSQNPNHTFTAAKNFNITLQIKSTSGCVANIVKTGLIQINTGVLADFTNDNPHSCTAPVTINFQNNSTGTGSVQYLWDFGDNTSSNLLNPSHTYTTNGTYSVKLMVVNNSGCNDTSYRINAVTIGSVKANMVAPDTICQNMTAQLKNTSAPAPGSVLWYFGDGTTSSQSNPAKVFNSAGNFNIKMVANFGACTDSVTKRVTVLTKPSAGFKADDTANCIAPFTVNFSSLTAGLKSYSWDFGDNNSSTLPNPSHTYNNYGSYTVKLIVTNSNGCTDTLQVSNYINLLKTMVTMVNVPDSGCIPFTKNFSLNVKSSNPITSYFWDFGDGTTSNSASPSHIYSNSGIYDVSVIVSTANGCTDTLKVKRAIVTNSKPVIDFSANPLNTCAKNNINFTDLSSGGVTKWWWDFGDSTTSTLKNPAHGYSDTGSFNIKLIAWNGGCSDTLLKNKYVHINPSIARFTVSSNCQKPFDRVFTDNSIGADQWNWSFGDGSTSTVQSPVHTYAAQGQYSVKLTVINNSTGCDYTRTQTINILSIKADFTTADTSICKGSPALISNNIPLNEISSLNWSFSAGSFYSTANSNSFNYLYRTPGTYTVSLIVTDLNGCKDTVTKINYINVSGPTAKFGVSAPNVCLKNLVSFKDSSQTDGTHPIQKWIWNYGDGTVDSTSVPPFQHLYQQTGLYAVKLSVFDSKGCVDSFKLAYPIIVSKPVANFTTNDSFSCPGKQVKFTNQSMGSNLKSQWYFGDNLSDTTTSPAHMYGADGIYSVKLQIADQYGCTDSVTIPQLIHINSPIANFIMSDSISNCPPLVINFTDSSKNVQTRKWDFGDSTSSTLTNPVHFYNFPGTYVATLTVTASGGCVAVFKRTVSIKGPQGSFTYTPITGCHPVNVNFTAVTSNLNSVVWDFNDGNTLGTPSLTASNNYLFAGSYVPKMILIDPAGCKVPYPGKDTIKVSGITANFSFNKKLLCDSGIISFADSSSVINDLLGTYSWNFGDGTTSTAKNPNHQYTQPGKYYPTLLATSQNGCTDSLTSAAAISIVASPKINIISSGNGCVPLTETFNSQLLVRDTSTIKWQWDFANGNNSNLANPPIQHYTDSGVYNVSLTGSNSSGCHTTIVKPVDAYGIPNVNAGNDTILCMGSNMTLSATGAANYSWSPSTALSCTNCAAPVTNTANSITYSVIGTSAQGCVAKDSIAITVKYKFNFTHSASDSVCKGSSKKLSANGGDIYNWTPSSSLDNGNISSPTAQPDTTTDYRVIAADNVGCFKDTGYITIRVNPLPTVEAGANKTINVGQSVDLVPTISPDVTDISWQPTSGIFRNSYPGITVRPTENTEYTVQVSNKGKCMAKAAVTVFVICNGSNVFIPNTFSPNGDGNNDIFYPRGTGLFKIKTLRIFNRWGQLVFERDSFDANNPAYGWDGTSRGVKLDADVFVYNFEVICDNGSILTYNGNIALIR